MMFTFESISVIFGRLFCAKLNRPDFVRQLGAPICEFQESSVELHRIACGLYCYARGDNNGGDEFFAPERSMPSACYQPSGNHAYIYTELLALAVQAREKRCLPHYTRFLWLKLHDPTMFLLLLNATKSVQPITCAGIVTHYMAEKSAGHAIKEPMVQYAQVSYEALRQACS